MLEDADKEIVKDHKEALLHLDDQIKTEFMAPNRIEQLFTIMAEDRHIERIGKKKFVTRLFDFEEYQRQLSLFHRKSRPKQLSNKYQRH